MWDRFFCNRWLYANGQWESDQKGFFVNLLTFSVDISYGKWDYEEKKTWAATFHKLGKW